MSALRNLIAAIDNAESVGDAAPPPHESSAHIAGAQAGPGAAEAMRRTVSERDLQRIIEAELWERDAQAEKFEQLGRVDDAARLRAESVIIARYRTSDD
jgi:hypothetical protein